MEVPKIAQNPQKGKGPFVIEPMPTKMFPKKKPRPELNPPPPRHVPIPLDSLKSKKPPS